MSYFTGKVIWVTGASSGIGEALVYALSAAGAKLILSSRRKEELERVKIRCVQPQNVAIIPFDQGVEHEVRQAFNNAIAIYGKIDMLFNNGGVSQRAEALQTSMELERRIFEINYFGNVLLSKLVVASMIQHGGGHLVITSSLLGKWGFHLRSSYAATKHALHGYYESLRFETEKTGIDITLVMPGFIATEISKHAFDDKGNPTGHMDANQAGGISAETCAQRILDGVSKKKKEFGVGGKEINGLLVRRFFPEIFYNILRKKSAR